MRHVATHSIWMLPRLGTLSPVIYLSGVIRHELIGLRPDLGFLATKRRYTKFDLLAGPWAADNDCFSTANPTKRPSRDFTVDGYIKFLRGVVHGVSTCLFAPAPDVVGDAAATLIRSRPILPMIRAVGFKAAFVAQDGATRDLPWDEFDALFIGGSTAFKLSEAARDITEAAKALGKWVHMGRVNGQKRLRTAHRWGCDSVDGTLLMFSPEFNTLRLMGWLDKLEAHK